MNLRVAFLCIAFTSGSSLVAQTLETVIQKGHELAVLCVAVSADSNFVVTGSRDKSAKLWETATGREVRSFLGHEASVTAVALSRDNQWLLTGSNDQSIRLWDVHNGKSVFEKKTINYITDVAIDPLQRFFAVAGYNRSGYGDSVLIFEMKTQRLMTKIPADPDKGNARGVDVAFSPDGQWLMLGEDNYTTRLFHTSDWQEKRNYRDEEGSCGGCGSRSVFSLDSKFVYLISEGGTFRKYPVGEGAFLREYEKDPDDLEGLSLSSDGKMIARSTEKEVKIWEEATGQLLSTLAAEGDLTFHEIEFTNHPQHLLISYDNNTAFVWDVREQKKVMEFTGFLNQRDKGGITYDPNSYWESNIAKYVRFKNKLLLSRDGKSLLKGKFGTLIKKWDLATGQTRTEFHGHEKAALCYALSKDGTRLLSGGGDGKIILWNAITGDSLQVLTVYRHPVFDVQFIDDETHVVSSSWDGTLRIHDLKTGKMVHYQEMDQQSVYNLLPHPNHQYVFTANLDNSLRLVERDTKSTVRTFVGHTDVVSSLQLSTNNQKLLSSSWDGSIRLWDVGTGLLDRKFKGHVGPVHIALFSQDGNTFFSGGADRVIHQWDISGKIIRSFNGHQAEVTSIIQSPDGKMLITHSLDGATKFWDLNSGLEFFEHIHLGSRDWLVKNPEGYFSGTTGARQYVHFVSANKTYRVEQFFDEYYRPDLLPRIFKNRGVSDEKKTIQGKLQKSPPPSVKLSLLPMPATNEAELVVQMKCNGAPVESFRLFHNGKSLLIHQDDLVLPTRPGESTTYAHTVSLIAGENSFSAVLRDKDKIESDVSTATVESAQPTKNSTCYILAVGINSYKNPKLTLSYARPDAESFVQTMKVNQQLFKEIELVTLYDEEASRINILKQLEMIASRAKPEDVFVFYYAGHGSMVENEFFFIPSESIRLYELMALRKEALEAATLQEKFKNIKALKQLIVMDACQSGGSVELLANRGAAEEKAIAQLSRSAGIHVMASAGSDQFATEFAELGHGLFTYVLIKALQGDADGAPKDGKVTIYELKSFLDDQVPELTRKMKGKPQYPYTFSRGQDFPVRVDN
jgi:WD40 repeat protein